MDMAYTKFISFPPKTIAPRKVPASCQGQHGPHPSASQPWGLPDSIPLSEYPSLASHQFLPIFLFIRLMVPSFHSVSTASPLFWPCHRFTPKSRQRSRSWLQTNCSLYFYVICEQMACHMSNRLGRRKHTQSLFLYLTTCMTVIMLQGH